MTQTRAGAISTGEIRQRFNIKSTGEVYRILESAGFKPKFIVKTAQKQYKYWPRKETAQYLTDWVMRTRKAWEAPELPFDVVSVPEVQPEVQPEAQSEVQPAALQEDMVLRELREIKDLLRQLLNVWR